MTIAYARDTVTTFEPTHLVTCRACNAGRRVPGEITARLARWETTVTIHRVPAEICDLCHCQYLDDHTSQRLKDMVTAAIKDGITSVIGEYSASGSDAFIPAR